MTLSAHFHRHGHWHRTDEGERRKSLQDLRLESARLSVLQDGVRSAARVVTLFNSKAVGENEVAPHEKTLVVAGFAPTLAAAILRSAGFSFATPPLGGVCDALVAQYLVTL